MSRVARDVALRKGFRQARGVPWYNDAYWVCSLFEMVQAEPRCALHPDAQGELCTGQVEIVIHWEDGSAALLCEDGATFFRRNLAAVPMGIESMHTYGRHPWPEENDGPDD